MKNTTKDFSSLLPSERPAVGETVKIISGRWEGYEGYVTGIKPGTKGMKYGQIFVSIEINPGYGLTSQRLEIKATRDMLIDANGDPMPEYSTQRELEIIEDRKRQCERLKIALKELGCELYDYFHQEYGMSHGDAEKFESGEEDLSLYLNDDKCEELGVGREWILYGDERSKEHPCGQQMKEYLNEHPEKREIVRRWMQEDGYTFYNWTLDECEDAYDLSGFDEDDTIDCVHNSTDKSETGQT